MYLPSGGSGIGRRGLSLADRVLNSLQDLVNAAQRATGHLNQAQVLKTIPQPLVLLSAPRAGSTYLFEMMQTHPGCGSIGGESHAIFRIFPHLRAENERLDSMSLSKQHADPETVDLFRRSFLTMLRTRQGQPFMAMPLPVRQHIKLALEKTPRNAFNGEFLDEVFPEAKYLYLYRDGRQSVSSLIEAWNLGLKTGRFVTFQDLPGWHLPGWCFALPPGWRDLIGKSIADIAVFQWAACQEAIMNSLRTRPRSTWDMLSYAELVENPTAVLTGVCSNLETGLSFEGIQTRTHLSKTTVSAPDPDKWKRHEADISPFFDQIDEMEAKIRSFKGE